MNTHAQRGEICITHTPDVEKVNDCSSRQTDTYNTGRWDEMSFFSHCSDSFS